MSCVHQATCLSQAQVSLLQRCLEVVLLREMLMCALLMLVRPQIAAFV